MELKEIGIEFAHHGEERELNATKKRTGTIRFDNKGDRGLWTENRRYCFDEEFGQLFICKDTTVGYRSNQIHG